MGAPVLPSTIPCVCAQLGAPVQQSAGTDGTWYAVGDGAQVAHHPHLPGGRSGGRASELHLPAHLFPGRGVGWRVRCGVRSPQQPGAGELFDWHEKRGSACLLHYKEPYSKLLDAAEQKNKIGIDSRSRS